MNVRITKSIWVTLALLLLWKCIVRVGEGKSFKLLLFHSTQKVWVHRCKQCIILSECWIKIGDIHWVSLQRLRFGVVIKMYQKHAWSNIIPKSFGLTASYVICTTYHFWLVWWENLFLLQLGKINTMEKWLLLNTTMSTTFDAQSFSWVFLQKLETTTRIVL